MFGLSILAMLVLLSVVDCAAFDWRWGRFRWTLGQSVMLCAPHSVSGEPSHRRHPWQQPVGVK
jgi:hypothetical protein